ncbi:MAG TPA: family 78 glycoside hydrolase catalytic domain [Caulobacteraceae bacterium]|nr:family 78 glycoside hydrolase catalytic domain [Caulobacteraceae bacterium]
MTSGPSVQVSGLSIDDDSGLVATGHAMPRLSWRLVGSAPDLRQEGYEIEVAAGPGFDDAVARSGFVRDPRPYLASWPADPLRSREVRWWRVRAHTNLGVTPWSASARVEASLLELSDWTARPICPVSNLGRETPGPAPLLRREFVLQQPVASARLYVTALGVHDVQINGQPVSADLLEPGWTVYPKRLLFAAYDVTGLLTKGGNAISAAVGDGWFRGDLTWELKRNTYGATTALLAQLEITQADGQVVVVATDENWRGGYGAVRLADLYHGADTDLRAEPTGWREAGFDDEGWEAVTTLDLPAGLEARAMPAVRVVERRNIPLPTGDRLILDVGQNVTGYLRIRARGPAGATIEVRHAEVLDPEGALYTAPLRKARATDTYTLHGGLARELAPLFTFHGFRYAQIIASPGVTIDAVTAEVVASDLRRTGWFACSDPDVNRLFENAVWSQRGNFLAVPTDCPQRDERLGWTGDLQVFGPTAFLNSDARSFIRSWLKDLALEQCNGSVPFVVPNALGQEPRMFGCAAWGDAATITPWDLYRAYGDVEVLRVQYDSMRAWVDWCASRTEPDGLWTQDFQFGDWLDPDAPPDKPFKSKVPYGFLATAHLARSAGLVSSAARLLGDLEAADFYGSLQARTAAAAWERWGEEAPKSQTGCALAIEFEIAPESQHGRIGAELAELVEKNNYRIGTGFVGTALILSALTRTGHLDVAYRLLLNPACPGWLYQVKAGATTIWERWDALRADGSVNLGGSAAGNASMVSFNHYAYGAVAAWLYRTVAGLVIDLSDPDQPLTVAPRPGGGLTWAEATVDTAYGPASVRWDLQGGELTIAVEAPPGARARFEPPDGDLCDEDGHRGMLGSGRHVLKLATARAAAVGVGGD